MHVNTEKLYQSKKEKYNLYTNSTNGYFIYR